MSAHVTDEAKLHFGAIHELCVFFGAAAKWWEIAKNTHKMVSILLTYPDAPCRESLPTWKPYFFAKCRWIFHKWSIRNINHQSHIKTFKSQHACQCDYTYSPLLKYHPRIILLFFSGLCSCRFGNRNSLTEFPGNDFGRIGGWLTMMNQFSMHSKYLLWLGAFLKVFAWIFFPTLKIIWRRKHHL